MAEFLAQAGGKSVFTCVTEGSVSQVVTQGDGFGEIFVQCQSTGDGTTDPGDLHSVGHTGTVVVTLGAEKHLGLVHQSAKCLAMDDPVSIPLVAGTDIVIVGLIRGRTTCAAIRKSRLGVESAVFLPLQFFPNGHMLSFQTGNARYSCPVSIPSTVPAVISVSLSIKGATCASGSRISKSTSAPNSVLRRMPPKASISSFTRS